MEEDMKEIELIEHMERELNIIKIEINMKENILEMKKGEGVYYFKNGDRVMRNIKNGKKIGKYVKLCSNGEIQVINFNNKFNFIYIYHYYKN